jgi:hypothetical protein
MIGKVMVKMKIVDCRDTLDTEGTTQESFPSSASANIG